MCYSLKRARAYTASLLNEQFPKRQCFINAALKCVPAPLLSAKVMVINRDLK